MNVLCELSELLPNLVWWQILMLAISALALLASHLTDRETDQMQARRLAAECQGASDCLLPEDGHSGADLASPTAGTPVRRRV